MRTFFASVAAFAVHIFATATLGSMIEYSELDIDLTDPAEAQAEVTWATPDIITVTAGGLGWEGDANSYRDGWILTEPMALGLSWRAPASVSIRVSIQPEMPEIPLGNGQTTTPYQGEVFVRYSPDASHWSTWLVLQHGDRRFPDSLVTAERVFSGMVSIPMVEREEYLELLQEYAELDVPWRSDEDAACHWILQSDPGFFERAIPFIGYVQFLYEGSFYAGHRITSLKAEVTYAMSGLHYAPENEDYGNRDSRDWSFTY